MVQEITPADIRNAIKEGGFSNVYQPLVPIRKGSPAVFEALSRLILNGEVIPPLHYVRTAEETGLIYDIDVVTMKMAVAHLVVLQGENRIDNPMPRMSINVSPETLKSRNYSAEVLNACRDAAVSPERLVLEVTEFGSINNNHALVELVALANNGVSLAIDNVDVRCRQNVEATHAMLGMKIYRDRFADGRGMVLEEDYDPSVYGVPLFQQVHVGRSATADFPNISEELGFFLEHAKGRTTVVEGIETREQAEFASRLGADYMQGFGLERPLSPEATIAWVQNPQTVSGVFAQIEARNNGGIAGPVPTL